MDMDRIMGVLTLKAPTYRQIADDANATTPAAIIVVVVALLQAVIGAVVLSSVGSQLPETPGLSTASLNPITFAVRTILTALIGWVIGGWVFAFVSKTFFGGKTNTNEMLRVFGYTQIFSILGIIPCLGIVGLILSVIGAVIGIREASEFDTTKAVLTGIVGLVALIVVGLVINAVLSAVGLA